ncbi:phage capsid protein [Pseudomonas proteolytica]|uniref:Phage capsid protein n=1 Tax=Pseudomonas proteolytica TaxID=219574 RepID=A0AAW4ZZF0_9PSED|nr:MULTISPECIES: GPO family capsid scaffolding protein [Pseudomonas]MBT9301649.1 GPO family capsid scaffolding protein [Pseudomonas sp. TAE6080]MCF5056947.1 phage capsid protein [Pseudomonas proteolytica]MCF5100629.1 phage capsid protein [Pseudomonas proteolytica]NNA67387.1 GPO family capsid scaffolding protein [Pseudomonas gessardii]
MAASNAPAQKFRSNWFRVAVEGATSDKRKIERTWLEQAAKNFSQNTYGARVWLEHFRSLLPDSPFKAYGDITAVKTEEVEIAGQKKLALFAQIEPTPELVAMNKAKQKIYTSIEIDESFADSGEAYIVGLAVTDSPASLGTDVLAFSAQKPDASPFKDRHYSATSMFTEALEAEIKFEEVAETENKALGLFNRVMDALGKSKDKSVKDDAQFSELTEAVEALANHAKDQGTAFTTEQTKLNTLQTAHEKLAGEFADLLKRLGDTEDHSQQHRPPATGGDGKVLTKF